MSRPPEQPASKPPPARGPESVSPSVPAKQSPPSASAGVRPASANEPGGGKDGMRPDSGEHGSSTKPTPVRALVEDDGELAQPAPDVAETSLTVDEAVWTVRVLGRSRGTPDVATTPLLLLGFLPEGASHPSCGREAWVVGHALSELTPLQLEGALDRAVPPPDPDRPRVFFGDAADRRRR